MNSFLSLPSGFLTANELLNKQSTEFIKILIQQIYTNNNQLANDLLIRYQPDLNISELDSIINSLKYINLLTIANKYNKEELNKNLIENTVLNQNIIDIITNTLFSNDNIQNEIFNIGKLDKMDWRIGVNIANSDCDIVNNAYVTLKFYITSSSTSSKQNIYAVDLSLPEFKAFAQTFRNISSTLESI